MIFFLCFLYTFLSLFAHSFTFTLISFFLFLFYEFSSWLLLVSLHSRPFTLYCDRLIYDPREKDAEFRPSETDASKEEPLCGADGQFFDLKIMEGKITHFVRVVEVNTRSLLGNHNGMSLSKYLILLSL